MLRSRVQGLIRRIQTIGISRRIPVPSTNATTGRGVASATTGATAGSASQSSASNAKAPPQLPLSPGARVARAVGIGALGGAMGSMVGVAGGVFMIPMTTAGLGYTQHQAIGGTLPAIVTSGVVGALSFAGYGFVDWTCAALLMASSSVAAKLGARSSAKTRAESLRRLLGGLMVVSGVMVPVSYLAQERATQQHSSSSSSSSASATAQPAVPASASATATSNTGAGASAAPTKGASTDSALGIAVAFRDQLESSWERLMQQPERVGVLVATGAAGGFVTGLLGVGGATVMIGLLSVLSAVAARRGDAANTVTHQMVTATVMTTIIPTAASALASHYRLGHVLRVSDGAAMCCGAVAGAYGGSKIAAHTSDLNMRYIFAAAMLPLGVRMILKR